jgi:hypothetical protein
MLEGGLWIQKIQSPPPQNTVHTLFTISNLTLKVEVKPLSLTEDQVNVGL